MKEKDQERRDYIRVGRSLLLSYKVIDAPDGHEQSFTRDISGAGMKIPFKEKPMVGTLLEIELDFIKEKKKIKFKGKVVRVKSVADERSYPYEAGIAFIDITPEKRTMLSNYVQYLNRHQLLR
jgi:c-di-GMP-binding flagellar brake protein YcgR